MLARTLKAQLILENGTRFNGVTFGYLKESSGEVVFYSGSAGYQETITDPAFAGKIVVMTHPLVGNYGINLDDNESDKPALKGLIVRECCQAPSHWRCEMDLDGYLKQHKIMGITGVDTRALTRALRDNGSMKGIITTRFNEMSESQIRQKFDRLTAKDIFLETTCDKKYTVENMGRHIGIIDFGLQKSMLRELKSRKTRLSVFPATASYDEIMECNVDAVFLSSGAGNPNKMTRHVELVKKLMGVKPVFGIGLGHELIALALGCYVVKMTHGHHGASYPAKYYKNGQIFITSQNHDYTAANLPDDVFATFVNINDGTVEGIRHKTLPVYSVQFIPKTTLQERSTGFIYDTMLTMIELSKEGK